MTTDASTRILLPSHPIITTITGWEGSEVPKFDRRDIGTSTGGRPPTSDNKPGAIGNGEASISSRHKSAVTPKLLRGRGTVKIVATNA
jgi:hypothetical protein